ncbi:PREDICTED: serine/arginine repetitive matrix protein 1-like [Ipomoea nil]|uniref:serine/arginine repetitive matrix protein 1-like n=1 Tax=Ipomoea nil TaxID=35883 RepID=UPI000900C67D|nr:PREDICTED: serine/arginine repetitive matrix protein 1-like [Ipomoea nil]
MSTPKRRSTSKRKTSGGTPDPNSPRSAAPPSPAATNSQLSNKVFSKEDEINLLKALLESTTDPNASLPLGHHVSETQIAAKIKRMKERYHKLAKSKSRIKTAHDEEVYQIARLIWGKQAKKPAPLMVKISGDGEGAAAEEPSPETEKLPDSEDLEENGEKDESGELDLGDFPYLVDQMALNFAGNNIYLMGLRELGSRNLKGMNEQWKVLMEEEAEFIAKKAQFSQELLAALAFKN